MSLSKKYLHNIDLFKNSLLNPILNPATTAERTAIGATLTTSDQGYVCFDITTNELYIWDGTAWITPSSNSVFLNDILVSLTAGKTVGRYVNGDTIPSAGKTAEQVITLISQEPLAPTITLTSPTTIQYNQTAISNVLNFSYSINSLAGLVSSAVLEWRRNNTGSWTTLSTSTATPGTFTHTLTDTNCNSEPFNYRYTVTDNLGGTATATLDITPAAYVAPSITFSAPGTVTAPETQTSREWGNTASTLQGSCTRNSPLVDILSYQYQVSVNGGPFANLGSSASLPAAGGSFASTPDTQNSATTTSLVYKVIVTDSCTTTSATYTISLNSMIFYGPADATATLDSALVRSLTKRLVTAANPFTFSTGTTEKRFIVAMQSGKTLTEALDITINVDLTTQFILSTTLTSINDEDGNSRPYNVYVYDNAIPYNPADTIRITYS